MIMVLSSKDPSAIGQIVDRAVEQNPHAADILRAFQPIIAEQRRLVSEVKLTSMDCSTLDREKIKGGVSAIRQIDLQGMDEVLKQITLSLAASVKEGMPALSEGLDRFCDLIRRDKISPADYFKSPDRHENKIVQTWGENLQVSPSNASFLMNLVRRVVLEKRADEITEILDSSEWEKGYCPVCGNFPSIALIEEEGGKRFLHCSSCGYDWRYTRVVCPHCEHEAQQGMEYYYIENKTQESAFICDQCKKYLVTLYRAGHLLARDMDVSAIALVHLDMIMQEKGYEPMTICAWNVLT